MFGTRDRTSQDDKALIGVLDRQAEIPALSALIGALKADAAVPIPLGVTAIALDSSVFLRLANHAKSADIIDYLSTSHAAPLILPGQAIQEFWNNQLQAVDTISSGLRKKFDSFRSDIANIDPNFGDYATGISKLLDEFSEQHGHIYDEGTVRRTGRLLDVLQESAVVPYVSRGLFDPIAKQRKKTKTPPGFRDDGDGDFFIWTDLLRGLQIAKRKRLKFRRLILVTEDKKLDWSRSGRAHPVLAAEVQALFNVPFEIWRLEQLAGEVVAAA